ncbi:MAG TPA: hypothetical protein VM186_12985 [Planctomycetota bacterium]|nr:hypothetical protein [Planctomycetota bacterium]
MLRGWTRTKLVCAVLIAALLAGMFPLQSVIERARTKAGLAPSNPLQELPSGEFFGTVLLGGFRAVAVDLIWLKAMEAQRNQDWHRYVVLCELTAYLQPRFIEVWIYNMWNMAYNISLTAPTEREGWEWVKKGIDFGKEGFRRNPDSWKLAWEIGFFYYHKCGTVRDDRGEQYQQWLFEETGQTNWQYAIDWFKKSHEIAKGKGNPNWLTMIASTYRVIAFEAEEKGDKKTMVENRLMAIEWIERIMKEYPHNAPLQRYGKGEIEDLKGRLKAHEDEERAAEFRAQGDTAKELDTLIATLEFWKKAFKGNPYQEEQSRHLMNVANRLEEIMLTGPEELRDKAALNRIEAWTHLLYGPEYVETYTKKCEQLDREYTAKLDAATARNDQDAMFNALDRVVRLRRGLYLKEGALETRVPMLKQTAELCQQLAERFDGERRELVLTITRYLWYDLLRFDHPEAATPGIPLLKSWVESTLRQIGRSEDPAPELARGQTLDVLSACYRLNVERDWAEQRLREIALFYADALDGAAARKDAGMAETYHRRSEAIWLRILDLHPDDKQAEQGLNRIDKILKIMGSEAE